MWRECLTVRYLRHFLLKTSKRVWWNLSEKVKRHRKPKTHITLFSDHARGPLAQRCLCISEFCDRGFPAAAVRPCLSVPTAPPRTRAPTGWRFWCVVLFVENCSDLEESGVQSTHMVYCLREFQPFFMCLRSDFELFNNPPLSLKKLSAENKIGKRGLDPEQRIWLSVVFFCIFFALLGSPVPYDRHMLNFLYQHWDNAPGFTIIYT